MSDHEKRIPDELKRLRRRDRMRLAKSLKKTARRLARYAKGGR